MLAAARARGGGSYFCRLNASATDALEAGVVQREASDVKAPARQEVWQVRRCRAHCRAIRSGAPGSFRTPKTRNGIVTGPVPGAPMRLFGARRTRGDRQPSGVLVAEIGPVPSRPAGGCVRRASRAPASPGLRRALEPSQQTAAFAWMRACLPSSRTRSLGTKRSQRDRRRTLACIAEDGVFISVQLPGADRVV